MKTYSAKPRDITRQWYLIDAADAPLGRVATKAASLLLGKLKPSLTPHIDGGDFVVIINAQQLIVTGNKLANKKYYRHSGFPGGLRTSSLGEELQHDPSQVIIRAIRNMLPDNKLRAGRLSRLKVYVDSQHNHDAQQPISVNLGKKGGQNNDNR